MDNRYKYLSDNFKFYENVDNIFTDTEYRFHRAEYHYTKRLTELLSSSSHKFVISPATANSIANAITKLQTIQKDNPYSNVLTALCLVDFATNHSINLNDDELLAIMCHNCGHNRDLFQRFGIGYVNQRSIAILNGLFHHISVVSSVTDIMVSLGLHQEYNMVNPKHLRLLDLQLSPFVYPYKQFERMQCLIYNEFIGGAAKGYNAGRKDLNYMNDRNRLIDGLFNRPGGLFQTEEFKRFEKKAQENEYRFRNS